MSKTKIHTIILHPQYAVENWSWLQRFVFRSPKETLHIFSCKEIRESHSGLLEFQGVMTKANGEKEDILLPAHVIVGVLLDQSHKNQFGFLNQEGCNEQ